MVDRIGGQDGALARNAILSALKRQAKAAEEIENVAAKITGRETGAAEATSRPDFKETISKGLEAVNEELRATERLPEDLITGKVDDFHEVAVQIKRADLSFKFAMEVRNKLIDAYREVMRMHV